MILCPAAAPEKGALLFGMVDRCGQTSYSKAAVPVSRQLLLELPVTSEHMFRFASPCAQAACRYWADECSLSSNLSEFQAFGQHDADAGECAIRSQCRWFLQNGAVMCSKCLIHTRLPNGLG
jgi:hypothetical protein